MKYYDVYLPMPVSVNASKQVSGGYWNKKTRKYERVMSRSKEHQDWIEAANREWRRSFANGVEKFSGRIGLTIVFVWPLTDRAGITSDTDNRVKVLQDFLQGKFFENDNQIDSHNVRRRLWGNKRPYAWVRIYEIPDSRFTDPALIFNS